MQTLINSLLNGTVEYQDEGVIVNKPPTATMLRAARELTTIVNINATNQLAMMQLQQRVDEQLNEILTLQEQNNEYRGTIDKLNAELQNLRNDAGQERKEVTSDVGCGSGDTSTSDSDGAGRGTN